MIIQGTHSCQGEMPQPLLEVEHLNHHLLNYILSQKPRKIARNDSEGNSICDKELTRSHKGKTLKEDLGFILVRTSKMEASTDEGIYTIRSHSK